MTCLFSIAWIKYILTIFIVDILNRALRSAAFSLPAWKHTETAIAYLLHVNVRLGCKRCFNHCIRFLVLLGYHHRLEIRLLLTWTLGVLLPWKQ
jgi:hypothetical protein